MTGYGKERIELCDTLIRRRHGATNGRFWTLEPGSLRFKHGESISELRIPYHLGGDDESCIENAVFGLIALLIKRTEPAFEGRKEPAPPQPLMAPVQELKKKTFRTDFFVAGSLEKRFANELLSSVSNIDSAIIAAWLGPDGHGRKFVKWAGDFFEKTLKDEAKNGGDEGTSYLALLAAINAIRKKKERIKTVRIKGITYEKLDLAVGLTLFITFKGALRDLLARLKSSNATCYTSKAEELLLSSTVPKSFLSIPSNLLISSLNPYGINVETFEIISSYAPFTAEKESGEFITAVSRAIKKNSEALDALKFQHAIIRFREETLKYLNEFDIPSEPQDLLYELYNDDRLIKNFLSDQKSTANLSKSLDDVKKNFVKDARRIEVISNFQRFLTSFKKTILGGIIRNPREDFEDNILPVIEGFYACKMDDHIEKFVSLMIATLSDKRTELSQTMLIEEYNRGRLYRFSTDDRQTLRTLSIEEEGQLFIDMKDFTKKTLKIKEMAMVEFMKDNFYKPILAGASRYGTSGLSPYEHGIRLTNLLGDAAIFSGGVTYLVAIARDIQKIIRLYREQLLKKLPLSKDKEVLDEVHRRFEARKALLQERRAELEQGMEKNEPGVESKLAALGEEEHRLENIYRDELRTAILDELEAGLFISYGAKSETMVIEPREEFSPPVKVSIGEKINEAARGTLRNPLVRAKIEVLLENEKQRRHLPLLKYPFDIYIERVYSIKMPPELDSAYEKLMVKRSTTSAQAMAQILSNEYFSDLKRTISGDPFSSLRLITAATDIYNKGQALSEAALEAYIRETKGTKRFFKKTVMVSELDPSIQNAFFFPQDPMEFWFVYEVINRMENIEIFRKSGEVVFKGFEANTPVIVYEMLNTEEQFFKTLASRHFHAWLEETKSSLNRDDSGE